MNSIQRVLLRSKHWEIFALWLAVDVFFNLAASVANHQSPFSLSLEHLTFPARIFQSGIAIVAWAWAYSAGSFFNSIMPAAFRLRPSVFGLAVGGLWILSLWPPPLRLNPSPVTLTYTLVGLLGWAYVVRFPAKTLVIVETRKPAICWQYFGTFFAAFFFLIGIWFIQPRIKEVYSAHESPTTSVDPIRPVTQLPA
jgi:hypothetical protein